MSGEYEGPQRWLVLVRVEELEDGIGVMRVVASFPTRAEVVRAFLREPDKHALAIFPTPFYVRHEPGTALPFEPGKHRGPNWVEDMDRALDQALGRPCFTKPHTLAEQAREAGREVPSNKVIDFLDYWRCVSFNPDI